jgi:uncharacterized protein
VQAPLGVAGRVNARPPNCRAGEDRLQAGGRSLLALLLLALAVASGGCATAHSRLQEAHLAYAAGDLEVAEEQLAKASAKRPLRECAQLDRALVALARGDAPRAEQMLRESRDRLDHLKQQSLAETGLAMATDERARAYDGEPYERVLIRALLTLANLMQDGSDATAYALQLDSEQRTHALASPAENAEPPAPMIPVPLGPYLCGIVHEQSHVRYDDAQRSFAVAASWAPAAPILQADLIRVSEGVHSAPGNGVLYVFTLVGPGPQKQQVVAEATSGALLVADQILSAIGDHTLPPTLAPVKIAEVVTPFSLLDGVLVTLNGRSAGRTETVTDVCEIARAQCAATRDRRLAEAVARRCLKKATVYTAKDTLQVGGGLSNLAFDAAGVVWEGLEQADTRCWSLLPGKFQALRVELPQGEYALALQAAQGMHPVGPASAARITIEDGRNTYLLASFPRDRLVGQILTSMPGR